MTIAWAAANAVLLEVSAPGEMDDFGKVAAAGTVVWEGEHEAQLQRARRTVVTDEGNTPVEADVLIVRKPPAEVATVRPGDDGQGMTVLVEDRRIADEPKKARFRVSFAEHRGKGSAESVRLELADEKAVP